MPDAPGKDSICLNYIHLPKPQLLLITAPQDKEYKGINIESAGRDNSPYYPLYPQLDRT